MAADTASMGYDVQFGVSAIASDTVTKRLLPESLDIKKRPTHFHAEGFKGQLAHRSEDTAESTYTVSGSMTIVPRVDDLEILLLAIFGGTFAGNVLEPDVITDYFKAALDREVKVFNYTGMRVSQATFTSSAGQPLRMQLQLEGKDLTLGDADSFPDLSYSVLTPIMHHQATMYFDGTARNFNNLNITVNNQLVMDRFFNTQSRTEIPQGDRTIQVSFDTPFTTSELDIYQLALAGVSSNILYTVGSYSLLFEFPLLQGPMEDPDTPSPVQEIPLRTTLNARTVDGYAGTDQEVKITLVDS